MKKAQIVVTICLILVTFIFVACDKTVTPELQADIALYSDNGTWTKSVTAAKRMFEWMGKSVALVQADDINEHSLNNFSILCFPGGDMFQFSQDISANGKAKIREFVRRGGGYIGICGGAYFASETIIWQGNQLQMTPLNLFKGIAEGTIDAIVPYPKYDMCQITIIDSLHTITRSTSKSQWMLYYWGPILKPKNSDVTILGIYKSIDQPAILVFEYGEGRVFLIGTHPEIEEDSDRDGVTLSDTLINGTNYLGEDKLDDLGSDWDLMKNAVIWCLD